MLNSMVFGTQLIKFLDCVHNLMLMIVQLLQRLFLIRSIHMGGIPVGILCLKMNNPVLKIYFGHLSK